MDLPSRIPWPPLIYLGAIISSYFLGEYYRLPWLPTIIADGLLAVGILMVLGGLAFDIYAIRTLIKHKQPSVQSAKLISW